jgi:hypothetical protein
MDNYAQEKFWCRSCDIEITDIDDNKCEGLCQDCYADMVQDQADRWGEPVEKVSNCCGATMYGVDNNGVGRCNDCKEMAEETETE